METSLHQQLKRIYAGDEERTEVRLDAYRIDAVTATELVEIQHGSLAAIRDKVRCLLHKHRVRVVKPLIARKRLVKLAGKGQPAVSSRLSPKRATVLELFDELIYFRDIFPHGNLILDVPLVAIEEWRYPVTRNPRRRRRHKSDHMVEDQKLIDIESVYEFRTTDDLLALLPDKLPLQFHTGQLAQLLEAPRWIAQKIAYCLRHMQAFESIGKEGNALMYRLVKQPKLKRRRRRA